MTEQKEPPKSNIDEIIERFENTTQHSVETVEITLMIKESDSEKDNDN